MQKATKYAVFRTKWGFFGLAGTENGLGRTCLPGPKRQEVGSRLLKNTQAAQFDRGFCKIVQRKVVAYYEGAHVDFGLDVSVDLHGFSPFFRLVLTACRGIRFGRTMTYGQLARKLGRPAAARAVGNALANNPLPLIIPCHRVLRSDGALGGFSAPGGTPLKSKMLLHEQRHSASHRHS